MPMRQLLRFTLLSLLVTALQSASLAATRPVSVGELNYRDAEDTDLEFLELVNPGTTSVALTGAQFTSGIVYTFTTATTLAPGERIVLVRDPAKFTQRYGSAGIRLAPGAYTGRLSDEGETVTLASGAGVEMLSFTYSPSGRWPSRPNGLGSTLECIDPNGDLDDPDNWRASSEWQGSPGRPGAGPQRVVVINEILAHTDPPFEDAIELLNLTDKPVDISGWYLSNTRGNPRKFRIPAGTVLPAKGYRVFYEWAGTGNRTGFNPSGTGDSPDFTFSSANGDEGVLMSADGSGNLRFWMDTVSFEASANGIPFGRHPNGTGSFTTLQQQSLGTEVSMGFPVEYLGLFRTGAGAPNAGPLLGPVVFHRIQYHPPLGGDEFVELRNITSLTLPLFDPLYPTNTWRLRDGINFNLPTGLLLEPNARLIIAPIDPGAFRTKYSIPASTPIIGPYTNALNNAGERLALYRPDPPQLPPHPDAGFVPYILVEEVDYSPNAPWPTGPDGTGPALRRRIPVGFANDPASWEADVSAPPTAPAIQIVNTPTLPRIRFTTMPGQTYRLERQAALGASWTDAGPIPNTGPIADVEIGAVPGFFRVRVP
jgi:hypothetical protein